MEVTVTIKDELITDVLANLPEYSVSMQCKSWDYRNCVFKFHDYEEEKDYVLDMDKARAGMKVLVQGILDGKYCFYGCKTMAEVLDPCCWDADVVDALVQCSLFGEIVYG